MKHTAPGRLQVRLIARYTQLRSRLTSLLGSPDGATAALNETWLRLDQVPEHSVVADPDAYLLRMASNIARKQFRADAPYLSAQDLGQLIDYADELADTERIVASRQAGQRLMAVLAGLPVRRRAMLVAAHLHGERNECIAREHGVSVSTVERELRLGLRTCQQELEGLQDEPRAKAPA